MASFTVEMYYDYAPKTCKNFIELARRGYYDNVKFHRIIKISLILYCKVGIQLGLAGVANQFMVNLGRTTVLVMVATVLTLAGVIVVVVFWR
ncbi:uncharacterized protein LOC111383739 isoform X2 [Olea europaea var. sylvestris]|uniref:uncharacterized protein LOC111383739 isoform X2 n=1 Tax=Olea europaea var. sylvestris TaxID=158386 RepID=UPI000C1D0523|nr:uncharacterized protein LOC111383739 isoform X2 [Olea europaea var. sylvestris]